MFFRLRYIVDIGSLDLAEGETLDFTLGGEHCVVVRLLHPIHRPVSGERTIVCEGVSEHKVEESIEDGFQRSTAGSALDPSVQGFFDQDLSELYDYMQKTVATMRWRCSLFDGAMNVFRQGIGGAYSFDGKEWREVPNRPTSISLVFGHPNPKDTTSERVREQIVGLVKQGATESLERQLFREAWLLRCSYPRASLVIGVAAAEIGFRTALGRRGGRKGILGLLKTYWPHPSPVPTVRGVQVKASRVLLDSLTKGIRKRNAVVHNGADAPDQDELREILWNIGQLLWIWDFYSGHIWALEHLTATSVEKAQSS
jgi:hypothetical protein